MNLGPSRLLLSLSHLASLVRWHLSLQLGRHYLTIGTTGCHYGIIHNNQRAAISHHDLRAPASVGSPQFFLKLRFGLLGFLWLSKKSSRASYFQKVSKKLQFQCFKINKPGERGCRQKCSFCHMTLKLTHTHIRLIQQIWERIRRILNGMLSASDQVQPALK